MAKKYHIIDKRFGKKDLTWKQLKAKSEELKLGNVFIELGSVFCDGDATKIIAEPIKGSNSQKITYTIDDILDHLHGIGLIYQDRERVNSNLATLGMSLDTKVKQDFVPKEEH